MKPERVELWSGYVRGAGVFAVLVHVAVMFNPHTTALRNLSLYAAIVLCALGIALARRLDAGRFPGLAGILLLFAVFVALSSLLGDDPAYSLNSLRKSLGSQLLFALAVWYLFRDANGARWLSVAFLIGLVTIIGVDLVQYAREFSSRGPQAIGDADSQYSYSTNTALHYWYSTPLSMMASYVVPMIAARSRGVSWGGGLLLALTVLLLIDANSRAAWIAAAASIAITLALLGLRRRAILLVIAGVVVAGIGAAVLSEKLYTRLANLTTESVRAVCCWGPLGALGAEKPLLGHGFGREIQKKAYERQRERLPEVLTYPYMGAHNQLLDFFFSCGIAGAGLLALLLARMLTDTARVACNPRADERWRNLLAPTAGTIAGTFLIAAVTQTLDYRYFGIYIGIALAAAHANRATDARVANPPTGN